VRVGRLGAGDERRRQRLIVNFEPRRRIGVGEADPQDSGRRRQRRNVGKAPPRQQGAVSRSHLDGVAADFHRDFCGDRW